MKKWIGAAGICLNGNNELLMVLEGEGKWTVPTGGVNADETIEDCVIREIWEETGYIAEISEKLQVKTGVYEEIQIAYEAHYFLVTIIGGNAQIQDPDNLVLDIAWKTEAELRNLVMNYPEDRNYLLAQFRKTRTSGFLV
ncbi:NUDIX hydrolase [Planococcus sp. YIM B11945]|uniref:NUDIX hydrolase n=1 Tax=Planococcus sp. YIM B11945 TaxID=3435410 RepID=UPI003D7E81F5